MQGGEHSKKQNYMNLQTEIGYVHSCYQITELDWKPTCILNFCQLI